MDQTVESYIRKIVSELNCDEHEKSEIAEEMTGHILLLKQEYQQKGFSDTESTQRALQSFGDEKRIEEGFQYSLFPYYKMFRKISWISFSIYSLIVLSNLLFFRVISRVINYQSDFNKYFYVSPESNGFFDLVTWQRNSNLIPFGNTYDYILGTDKFNIDIVINNTLGNILIFIPLGIFLPILFKKYRTFTQVLMSSMIISLTIEVLQFSLQIGQFDIDDVILNTVGGAVGYLIIKLLMGVAKLSRWTIFYKTTS